MRTLVVGEALVDVVRPVNGEVAEHVGGSPLNVAIGLARLGHPAQLATFIGDDDRGAAIRAHLAADDVQLVAGSDGAERTATAEAVLDETGAATYTFDIDWQVPYELPAAEHLHTGSIAAVLQPGASAIREACFTQRAHGTISYDPNCRPQLMGEPGDARSDIEQLVGLCDVVKASDEDVRWLYGEVPVEEIARLWAQLGPALVVVTRGSDGAVACLPSAGSDDAVKTVAGQSVSVTDTVGAGDSFMSGLLSGLSDAGFLGSLAARSRFQKAGWDDVLPALERAVAAASITVSRAGANPPTRADLAID
ncbi:fructokinase [Yimella lutea]|uniref:Fructokinase n=1 Tax=Yimella lutea TaxID=587872 RepID=A0A542EEG3_9MICO|nr:carbohydrate kinase [Yimella lutea]TQJ13699.1 fructokinase [Yimella lutea]